MHQPLPLELFLSGQDVMGKADLIRAACPRAEERGKKNKILSCHLPSVPLWATTSDPLHIHPPAQRSGLSLVLMNHTAPLPTFWSLEVLGTPVASFPSHPSLPFSLLLHAYCPHLPLLFSPLIHPFFPFALPPPAQPPPLSSPQGSAQQGWHSPRVPPFPPHLI